MVKKMNNKLKGMLITLVSAASFGVSAPIAKFIYKYGITPNFMLALRFSIATLFIWGYIFLNRKKIKYKLNKDQLLIMMAIGGLVYFLTTAFYFNAIKFIPVSIHVMIFYTYPFMVNIFAFLVLKENISKIQLISMVIAFIGLLLTISINSLGINSTGLLLSLLAALFNGMYILLLGLKKIGEVDSIVTAAYTNLFSSISFFVYCGVKGEVQLGVPFNAWVGIVFIALVSTAIAIVALSKGVRMIGASKASIISTFEPLEGVFLSLMFLGESMNLKQIIGGVLILVAIIMINSSDNKKLEIAVEQV
jgi:drug/metabolite transporter (DMT)-like permease